MSADPIVVNNAPSDRTVHVANRGGESSRFYLGWTDNTTVRSNIYIYIYLVAVLVILSG